MLAEVRRRWGEWRMDGFAKAFILASLGYLSAGATLGLMMAAHDIAHGGEWGVTLTYLLLPSHTHLMLLGWVSQLIFGVAYHLLPRVAGGLVWSPRLGWWHFWLANAGLLGMAAGFFLNRHDEGQWYWLLAVAGTAAWVSVQCFVVNMAVTLWRAAAGTPIPPTLVRRIAGGTPARPGSKD